MTAPSHPFIYSTRVTISLEVDPMSSLAKPAVAKPSTSTLGGDEEAWRLSLGTFRLALRHALCPSDETWASTVQGKYIRD